MMRDPLFIQESDHDRRYRQRQQLSTNLAMLPASQHENLLNEADFLSPAERKRILDESKKAVKADEQRALEKTKEKSDRITAMNASISEEAESLNSDLADLMERGKNGMLSAAEYQRELEQLERREKNTRRSFNRLDGDVDAMSSIETDPVGYIEGLKTKFPALRTPQTGPHDGAEWARATEPPA